MEHSVKQFRLELMQEAQTIWLTAADFSISEESENFIRYCRYCFSQAVVTETISAFKAM